jgi:hypothetical protein
MFLVANPLGNITWNFSLLTFVILFRRTFIYPWNKLLIITIKLETVFFQNRIINSWTLPPYRPHTHLNSFVAASLEIGFHVKLDTRWLINALSPFCGTSLREMTVKFAGIYNARAVTFVLRASKRHMCLASLTTTANDILSLFGPHHCSNTFKAPPKWL